MWYLNGVALEGVASGGGSGYFKDMRFSPSHHSAYRNSSAATATTVASTYGIDLGLASSIVAVADEIGVPPDWLANVIRFESKFNPQAVNPVSGATGLIQFMGPTASEVGTTLANLKKLTAVQQMAYVAKYFKLPRIKGKGPLRTQLDVFMAVIWPAAIGKGPSYQIFKPGSLESKQNFGIVTAEDYYNLALYGTKPSQTVSLPEPIVQLDQLITDSIPEAAKPVIWPLIIGGIGFAIVGFIALRRASKH